MLSVFLIGINSIKSNLPIIALFGSAPTFFTFWILLRSFTFLFSSRHIYRKYDDHLYSIYQRFVLFFFQNWVNVKIYLHGDYQQIFNKKENVLYISNHQCSG
jgi:lysophosphatidate acyltransferase